MMTRRSPARVTSEGLKFLDTALKITVIAVDSSGIAYTSPSAGALVKSLTPDEIEKLTRSDMEKSHEGKVKVFVEKQDRKLVFEGQEAILADAPVMLYEVRELDACERSEALLKQTLRQRDLMLEVSKQILKMEDLGEIFHFILKQVILTIDKGAIGSVMIKEGDQLKVVAAEGYAKEVYGFRLPVEESFLYKATQGRMDGVAVISDVDIYEPAKKFYVENEESRLIKSSISAPIFYDEELFGLINIDSTESHAFDETDKLSMEFIRVHSQIAVSNHFLFQEKVFIAHHDHLTKLYNRYYFDQEFERLRHKALRYRETFSLVMVDVDELKKINDESGHLAGDAVIVRIADEMKKSIRSSDVLARYGGDEFIGVFFKAEPEALDLKFRQILDQMKDFKCQVKAVAFNPSFSYGIARFPEDGTGLDTLIRKADERMYLSKERRQD